jgi:integrase
MKHTLGKGEVESSILSHSTISTSNFNNLSSTPFGRWTKTPVLQKYYILVLSRACYRVGMSKVMNQQSFHDGKVVLYQLSDRPQNKWLCRLKDPNGNGYLYRGTGTSDFYEARKFADNLFDQLRLKVLNGTAVTGKTFKSVFASFIERYPLEAPSKRRADAVIEVLKAYAFPYFSKHKITDLSDTEIAKFVDWRRANPKQKTPSNSTIVSELGKLKVFLDWCNQRGFISSKITLKKPSVGDNRRPHFDSKDWRVLMRFLRQWIKQGEGKSGPVLRDRTMLVNYVLILANTGIRVGEARALRWADIDLHQNEGGESIILRVTGKTGTRDVVARTSEVQKYLQRIHEMRVRELGTNPPLTEHIFCHADGRPIYSFKKGFETLIREAGVEFDSGGNRRVIYSLRHTYATFRLQEGVNHYAFAQNMGTSVKMLEAFYGHTTNRSMSTELMKTSTQKKKALPWQIAPQKTPRQKKVANAGSGLIEQEYVPMPDRPTSVTRQE